MKRALIIGRGKSGEAAEKTLAKLGYGVEFAENYDLVVASPGVPVKSELQLGCEELKKRGWKLLAVTGSKGKSSVVKLVAEAIGGIPCGNYGRAVNDLLGEAPGWAVVEVSSFQLETTTLAPDTFEAAAILNLQEDHIDRHCSVEIYHKLKCKLLTFAKVAYDSQCGALRSAAKLLKGSYFDNDVLLFNGMQAIRLMRVAGLDDAEIKKAFARFKPLPHRMQKVATIDGVKFIDDSKATSIAALGAGVQMCGAGVRLIAGGLAKGDDPLGVITLLTKAVKKVYLIGECAKKLEKVWSGIVDCEVCETLENAVKAARRDAVKGETVLLSPGTASFDQFKNFEERGEVFARLVKQERKTNEEIDVSNRCGCGRYVSRLQGRWICSCKFRRTARGKECGSR